MQQCAPTLKKLSLELGGNSPFIVFNDAKMETALDAAVLAKFRNSGQTCVTANRIFVQSGIYDEFAKQITERIKKMKVGAGTDDEVFVGPLTHDRAVEKAMNHIEDAKKHGGQVIYGGAPMEGMGKGYFMQPTVITGMSREMITTREETFAPVVGLYKFETEEEAIELANDCDVGLGSFVMTQDIARSWRVAEALEVGYVLYLIRNLDHKPNATRRMVGINIGMLSAAESPFGGVKGSGKSSSSTDVPFQDHSLADYSTAQPRFWSRRRHSGYQRVPACQEHVHQCCQLEAICNQKYIVNQYVRADRKLVAWNRYDAVST